MLVPASLPPAVPRPIPPHGARPSIPTPSHTQAYCTPVVLVPASLLSVWNSVPCKVRSSHALIFQIVSNISSLQAILLTVCVRKLVYFDLVTVISLFIVMGYMLQFGETEHENTLLLLSLLLPPA